MPIMPLTKAVPLVITFALLAALASPKLAALTPGETVRSIPDADRIEGWTAIDNQRVIVDVAARDSYLLTLKHQCHALGWARNVTVSMSNNTIWAGFDAIRADGLQCPIEQINRIPPEQLLKLKGR
jgi:hypothetical protein